MTTALVSSSPNLVAVCVAVAALAGFWLHEPLLVLWGQRGLRAQRSAPGAGSRAFLLMALHAGAGVAAMIAGSNLVRAALFACLTVGLVGFAVAVAGRHRTLFGQLWGVMGLSLPALPILLAGGRSLEISLDVWLSFLLGFVATTVAVRAVVAFQKRQPRRLHAAILTFASLAAVILVAERSWIYAAIAPMLVVANALAIWTPSARYLRRIGWSLVGTTMLSALLVCLILWEVLSTT